MKKVYCENCMYHVDKLAMIHGCQPNDCLKVLPENFTEIKHSANYLKPDYTTIKYNYEKAYNRNFNNNCKYYLSSWLPAYIILFIVMCGIILLCLQN